MSEIGMAALPAATHEHTHMLVTMTSYKSDYISLFTKTTAKVVRTLTFVPSHGNIFRSYMYVVFHLPPEAATWDLLDFNI